METEHKSYNATDIIKKLEWEEMGKKRNFQTNYSGTNKLRMETISQKERMKEDVQ